MAINTGDLDPAKVAKALIGKGPKVRTLESARKRIGELREVGQGLYEQLEWATGQVGRLQRSLDEAGRQRIEAQKAEMVQGQKAVELDRELLRLRSLTPHDAVVFAIERVQQAELDVVGGSPVNGRDGYYLSAHMTNTSAPGPRRSEGEYIRTPADEGWRYHRVGEILLRALKALEKDDSVWDPLR